MKQGLYLYNADKHQLDPVLGKDIRDVTGKQDFMKIAPVNLIFVANLDSMSGGKDEKIRYATIDTGYISQNTYLYCASEGLATVAIGWYDENKLSKAMNLKSSQKIMLTMPVGFPKK